MNELGVLLAGALVAFGLFLASGKAETPLRAGLRWSAFAVAFAAIGSALGPWRHRAPDDFLYLSAVAAVGWIAIAFFAGFFWQRLRRPQRRTAAATEQTVEAAFAPPTSKARGVPLWLAAAGGATVCAVAIFSYREYSESNDVAKSVPAFVREDPTVVFRLSSCEECTTLDGPRACRLRPTTYVLVNRQTQTIEWRLYNDDGTFDSSDRSSGLTCSVTASGAYRCTSERFDTKDFGRIRVLTTFRFAHELDESRYLSTSSVTSEKSAPNVAPSVRPMMQSETRCVVERSRLPR